MRRTLLAALAAATIASPALAAPSSVTVNDPAADWPVTSQDMRRIRLSSDGKSVTVTFDLLAAPTGMTQYQAFFATAKYCDEGWMLTALGAGTTAARAEITRDKCDPTGAVVKETAPAALTVRGNTLEVTAPYTLGLKRGMTIKAFNGAASTVLWAVGAGMDPGAFVWTGDIAFGQKVSYQLR